jgi:hypothetical protein
MKRFHKYSLQIAAAAILAVVLTLAAPRAVHAVAAALVNVTNTAASPAISQGVSQLASQNVFLAAAAPVGGSSGFSQEFPDGSLSISAFVVPSGQSLVVTSLEVFPLTNPGTYTIFISNGVSGKKRELLAAPAAYSTQFQFPSGIVFPAGESPQFFNLFSSPEQVTVYMHGYLTSN